MRIAPVAVRRYVGHPLIEARGAERMRANTERPVVIVPATERSELGLTRWPGALAVPGGA